jgi:hypothetical protein
LLQERILSVESAPSGDRLACFANKCEYAPEASLFFDQVPYCFYVEFSRLFEPLSGAKGVEPRLQLTVGVLHPPFSFHVAEEHQRGARSKGLNPLHPSNPLTVALFHSLRRDTDIPTPTAAKRLNPLSP